jgi:hypothetical protein
MKSKLTMTRKVLLYLLILMPLFCSAQEKSANRDSYLRELVKNSLRNKITKQILVDKIVPDKETAVAVAESILFRIYGKAQIIGEKPYNVDLVNDYWILSGTLPEGYLGGTFLIILSAKDGRVIKLTHGK